MTFPVLMRTYHRNARVSVLTEPLWAIFGTAAIFYLALFMSSAGLSYAEIGVVVSVNLYIGFLFQLLAGPITNRLGRKRATFWFDITSWVVPMAIWAFSDNFWFFLIGYVFNATSRVVNVSFWLLATENSPESERPRVFAAIKVIIMLAGLVVPVVGLLVAEFGELPTYRALFLLGAIAMLAHNLIRNAYCEETDAGLMALRDRTDSSYRLALLKSVRLFRHGMRCREIRPIFLFYVVTYLAFQLGLFQAVYLSVELGFGPAVVGVIPAVAALAALAWFALLMPRLEKRLTTGRAAFAASIATCAGWAAFLLVPPGGLVLVVVSVALIGAGTCALESYRDALVVNTVHADDRADAYAVVQSAAAMVSIPAGILAAVLYERGPVLPFVAVLALYAVGASVVAGRKLGTRQVERLGEPT